MDEQEREALVEQFRHWLETEPQPCEPQQAGRMELFQELAGLKTEIHLESRWMKGALAEFRSAFTSLEESSRKSEERNREMFAGLQQRAPDRSGQTALLDGLLDLHDRLQAGLTLTPPKSTLLQRLCGEARRRRAWQETWLQGQKMLLSRVLDLLARSGITPMEVVGTPFNPAQMRAVGTLRDSRREEAVVLQENRRGFLRGDTVFRPADVIVNRRKEQQ